MKWSIRESALLNKKYYLDSIDGITDNLNLGFV